MVADIENMKAPVTMDFQKKFDKSKSFELYLKIFLPNDANCKLYVAEEKQLRKCDTIFFFKSASIALELSYQRIYTKRGMTLHRAIEFPLFMGNIHICRRLWMPLAIYYMQ